jgi:hypothetical protein
LIFYKLFRFFQGFGFSGLFRNYGQKSVSFLTTELTQTKFLKTIAASSLRTVDSLNAKFIAEYSKLNFKKYCAAELLIPKKKKTKKTAFKTQIKS